VEPSSVERLIDCVADGELIATAVVPPGERIVSFSGLRRERKRIDLYLSQVAPVTVVGLQIEDGASWEPVVERRPRWLTYGSSITQCASAASPAQTWPAIASRAMQLQLTCLGYRGNCHLEPMVARMMRDLPADFISLCLGINVHNLSSYSIRTFRAAVIGFIEIVRERHADIPILVISPIVSPSREDTPCVSGLTIQAIREEIEAALDALRQNGADNLHYLHGLQLFGSEYSSYLPDGLHPDAEGYRIMGSRFEQWVVGEGIRERVSRG
jgi:hypothetical protein